VEDVDATFRSLREHEPCLDRVALSRFKAIPGARLHDRYARSPERFPDLAGIQWDLRYGRAAYRNVRSVEPTYGASKRRLLEIVHRIDSRPLRVGAEPFDGLMRPGESPVRRRRTPRDARR
jgi:hypothetical protein